MKGRITELRDDFHRNLINQGILGWVNLPSNKKSKGHSSYSPHTANNADKDSRISNYLASDVLATIETRLGLNSGIPGQFRAGQTQGSDFEKECQKYLELSFKEVLHLRNGTWQVHQADKLTNIGTFEQYSHLIELDRLADEHQQIKNFLGNGYVVKPDVVIVREAESDQAINSANNLVDNDTCKLTYFRKSNQIRLNGEVHHFLHASVSCKFTMRSDRAQNTRTEALNLIRSRKGRVPHIVVITAEPMPSRLSSLAQGTGDIDCVYHIALDELVTATKNSGEEEAQNLLQMMIDGKRLKDIADLPLDLVI